MDPRVPLVLDTQFVKQRREQGAMIWVLDQRGTSWHADDSLHEVIDVPSNGLKAVTPEYAKDMENLLRQNFGRNMTAWLPMQGQWFRVDVYWINVFIVLAMWPEHEESKWHVHKA